MINPASLLPSLSRSSGLSPRSSIGLNIIRRDSISVDRLLKERLVLSKVRYGIERQQQERERRRNREADLEADSKQNYEVGDAPNDPRKRRKGIGGLLGTVFGGILSSLGGVAFQAAPAFLLARNNIIKGGSNFNRTIGATDGLLNTIKGQKGPFDTLRKVKLDPVKNIGKTITKFGNSLTLFVNSAIAGQIGGRALNKLRTPAQVKAQVAQSAKARQKITSKVIARETVIVKEVAKQRAKKRSVSVEEGVKNPIRKVKTPVRETVTAGRKIRDQEKFLEELGLDPNLRKFGTEVPGAAKTRPIPLNKGIYGSPEVDQFFNEITNNKTFNNSPTLRTKVDNDFQLFLNARNPSVKRRRLSQLLNSLKSGNVSTLNINRLSTILTFSAFKPIDPTLIYRKSTNAEFDEMFNTVRTGEGGMGIEDPFDPKPKPKPSAKASGPFSEINTPAARAKRFKESFGKPTGADPFTGKGTYQITPTITSFDPETGVTTQTLTKGREFDPITGEIKAKKRTVKASKVTNKKGIGKFLSNIGGSQFLKPVKEFVGKGVKNIPFIGDLIGILLDVFVFGEPIQRALFLAGGSALGGFLGGLAGTIGGPPGVLIGGIIGGIAGDLLGGAFYDLLFRRGQKGSAGQRFGASATKASIKAGLYTGGFAGYGTYMLGEGGREFVLDADSTAALERRSPGFLMALNKARGAEAISVIEDYASYDKASTGKEKMVPIPIPIPQKESPVQEIMMTDSEAGGGTGGGSASITFFSEHYRRG